MSETLMPSRSDRAGMYMYIGFALIGIIVIVWLTVTRLVEVAPGVDVPVTVTLNGQDAALPLGPGGAPVDAAVESATVIVPKPAAATLFALWAQPVVIGLAQIAGIAVAALFCLRLARGRAFQRGTAALVYTGVGILAVGWILGSLFTTMSNNGALSAISDYSYDIVRIEADFVPVFLILLLTSVGTAFQLGERMKRDTEGLV